MFSYLRSHHKRSGSTPTSPDVPHPPLPPPKNAHDETGPPVPSPDFFPLRQYGQEGQVQEQTGYGWHGEQAASLKSPISNADSTPVSPYPPVLPPIARVSSVVGRSSPERELPNAGSEDRDVMPQEMGYGHRKKSGPERMNLENWRDSPRLGVLHDHYIQPPEQSRIFYSVERPGLNGRPHTSQGPTGLRSRGQSVQGHANGRSSSYRAFSSATSPAREQIHASPSPAEPYSRPSMSSQSASSTSNMTSGFLSVAYDDARSRTPPVKLNGPGRPSSPPQPVTPNSKPKQKLNLRNPMSLLLRRRENHNIEPVQLGDDPIRLGQRKNHLPDNDDPRIFGKIVHDFSAPRPPPKKVYAASNANFSSSSGELRLPSTDEEGHARGRSASPYRHKRAHTPTFVENFDDDSNGENNVRAEELANKEFVARNALPSPDQDKELPLPPFAKRASGHFTVPANVPAPPESSPENMSAVPAPVAPSRTPPIPPRSSPNTEVDNPMGSITATPEVMKRAKGISDQTADATASPPTIARQRRSRLGLPPHLDSTASRFSFQFAGQESHVQEKILEERHKAKQAQAVIAAKMRQEEEDFVEDDDAYDDFEGAGMYEEQIPGVNADYDDYGFEDGFSMPEGLGGGLANSTLASSTLEPSKMKEDNPLGAQDLIEAQRMALRSNPPSPAGYSPASLDSGSLRAPSTASARPSFNRQGSSSLSVDRTPNVGSEVQSSRSQDLSNIDERPQETQATLWDGATNQQTAASFSQELEDDLYFDDGLIEDPGDEDDVAHFDESQFDDPSHHLYERKPVGMPPGQIQPQPTQYALSSSQRVSVEQASETSRQRRVTSLESNAGPFSGTTRQHGDSYRKSHLSDFENLDAYHGALASAASQAFADGRFAREESISLPADSVMDGGEASNWPQRRSHDSTLISDADRSSKPSAFDSSGQSQGQDGDRTSDSSTFSAVKQRTSGFEEDHQGVSKPGSSLSDGLRIHSPGEKTEWDPNSYTFGGDSDLDDAFDENDPIIAAANAEALANDDEGEYGREFGFYAAPPPSAGLPNASRSRNAGDFANDSCDEGSDSEWFNGGYFGPKGVDLVGRNRSVREPNLTPITERSEYSTRNSCISLFGLPSAANGQLPSGISPITAGPPGSAGPMPSPGLAQLARSPLGWDEDDMSFERLMKLRSRAWGEGGRNNSISDAGSGSAAGNRSSSRDSSPVAAQSGGFLLPKSTPQPQHPISPVSPAANAQAVGWLNGVGVGAGGMEGLQRLGEDDLSSSEEEDVEGEQDSDYDANNILDDCIYDDEDSSVPDSPTVTAADSGSIPGSSPFSTTAPELPRLPPFEQMQAQYNGHFQHVPGDFASVLSKQHLPSAPNPNSDRHTPVLPTSATYPLAAASRGPDAAGPNHNKSLPQLPSSPSPRPRPDASVPHSPAHSRNNSANEGVTVTYVKERDSLADGGVRWVMERKRTEMNGEVTVLGRQIVTGGRI